MTIGFPHLDLPDGLTGGRDAWDDGAAGAILSADFYSGVTSTAGLVKVWLGTAWVLKPLRIWTGSVWSQKPVKRWTGAAWV